MPPQEKLWRSDPQHRQEARRRLVQLYLLVGGKVQTANTHAKDLLKAKDPTAFDYRLLADTYTALAVLASATAGNNTPAWAEAITNNEKPHRQKPGNS